MAKRISRTKAARIAALLSSGHSGPQVAAKTKTSLPITAATKVAVIAELLS